MLNLHELQDLLDEHKKEMPEQAYLELSNQLQELFRQQESEQLREVAVKNMIIKDNKKYDVVELQFCIHPVSVRRYQNFLDDGNPVIPFIEAKAFDEESRIFLAMESLKSIGEPVIIDFQG